MLLPLLGLITSGITMLLAESAGDTPQSNDRLGQASTTAGLLGTRMQAPTSRQGRLTNGPQ